MIEHTPTQVHLSDAETAATGRERPALVVFTRVFPNASQPTYGLFVRERMFRVAAHLPLVVVAPVPWFPGQGLIRHFRPHYRPAVPYYEVQQGVEVYHPRFLCVPGIAKSADGLLQALGSWRTLRRLHRAGRMDVLDAHFIYPDGVAAWLLGRWFDCPWTITLRGTINRIARTRLRRWLSVRAMQGAARVFSVSDALRQLAVQLGADPDRVQVVPNGINLEFFSREDRAESRRTIGVPCDARILLSVGTLNERKGMHHIIAMMPALMEQYPDLHYVLVGSGNPDGDDEHRLRRLAAAHGVTDHVHFAGSVAPAQLRHYYSAADLFVLATRSEGWANVLLEALACGCPVVTTDVGGNSEVICDPKLGRTVPYGQWTRFRQAIVEGLETEWDRKALEDYASANAWESRLPGLIDAFHEIHLRRPTQSRPG